MYSFYIFLWATITGSIFILFIHFLLKDTSFLLRTGLGFFAVCTLLCVLRLFTPLEFSPLLHKIEYPGWVSGLIRPRYLFHTEIPAEYALIAFSLMVSFILLCRYLFRTAKISRTLFSHSTEDPEAESLLHTIDDNCGIRVRRTELIKGPVIIGVRRPVIYLPEMELSVMNLSDILRHEYTHWKRHHLPIKILIQLVTILFWWNPCIYILARDLSHIIEMICDEYAMNRYDKMEKVHYMSTLIHCLRRSSGHGSSAEPKICGMGFVSSGSGRSTKQRVSYHLNKAASASRRRVGVSLLYALAFCWMIGSYFIIFVPAYTPDKQQLYSEETEAYLVEKADGTYEFHFGEYVVPVTREEMESDRYMIYPVLSEEEAGETAGK